MAKMHELLAVESTVVGNYNRDMEETLKVLGRADLFTKTVKVKSHFNEDDKKLDTTETKDITTTVKDRLKWFAASASKFYDVVLQKDSTNQQSNADIEVDGTVIANAVPATTLLMFETKLQDLRKVLEAAPTLPAGFTWIKDENTGLMASKEPNVTFTTRKVVEPVVLYEATKEHPAQVKEASKDVPVAKVTVDTWSGMMTSVDKAELLSRLDKLLQAVKKARQRANSTEVVKANVGDAVFKYLFDGVIK